MRIAVLTGPFDPLPPDAIGAVAKLFWQLGLEWKRLGHKVVFYASAGGDKAKCDIVHLWRMKRTGSLKWDLVKSFFYAWKFWFALRPCDVVLLNDFWVPVFAPLFRKKYKKSVYGIHRFPKGQFWLYRFVDQFIGVSNVVVDAAKAQQPKLASRMVVVNNPIDTSVFKPEKKETGSGTFLIVYTGRIHPEKGLTILAEACNSLKSEGRQIRLRMIGSTANEGGGGGDAYVRKLKSIFSEIEFVEPISDPTKLAAELQGADCYVYPSIADKGEAFGVAPLEAMACGVPVILSDLDCFTDLGKSGEHYLVFTRGRNASVELAAQIKWVMDNDSQVEVISKYGAIRARSFSIDRIACEYLNLFGL